MIKTILALLGAVALFCWTARHCHTQDNGSSMDAYAHVFGGHSYVIGFFNQTPTTGPHGWYVTWMVLDYELPAEWNK